MYRAHTTSVGDGFRSGYNQLPSFLGNTSGVRTGNLLSKPNFSNNARVSANIYTSLAAGGQYIPLTPLIASGWFELRQNAKTKYLQFKASNTGNGTLQIPPMKADTQGTRLLINALSGAGSLCIVSYYDMYDRESVVIGTSLVNFQPSGNISKLVSIYVVTTATTNLEISVQHALGNPYFDMNNKRVDLLAFMKNGSTLQGSSATATYGTFLNPFIARTMQLTSAITPINQYLVTTTQNPATIPSISRLNNNTQSAPANIKTNIMMLQNNPNVLGVERNKFNPEMARAAEGWTPNSNFWTNWIS